MKNICFDFLSKLKLTKIIIVLNRLKVISIERLILSKRKVLDLTLLQTSIVCCSWFKVFVIIHPSSFPDWINDIDEF